MPHDKNGAELKVGDRVTVEFTVESISPGTDYCNVTLKSVEGRKPDGMKECLTGNAGVCVKVALLLLALFSWASPAAAQEKEFVLDTRTGRVSQKDVEQDKEIAALKAEVAALKAKLAPAVAAPGVAVNSDPFARPCEPCGPAGCPIIRGTSVRSADSPSTFRPVPVQSEELTYTVVPRGTSGITSGGCAGGSCVASTRTRWYPGKNLGR